MKSYLKENKPLVSIILTIVLLGSTLLTMFLPDVGNAFILHKANLSLSQPGNWYRFVTYPLYIGSINDWLVSSLLLLLMGAVIERRMYKSDIVLFIFLSTVVGGIVFMASSHDDLPLAAPGNIIWGYCSATMVLGFRNWFNSESIERVALIACVLFLFLQLRDFNVVAFATQLIVMLLIGTLVWVRYKKIS